MGLIIRGLLAVLAAAVSAGAARAACTVGKLGELPVTMEGLQPTVSAKINGGPVTFVLDSGAFYSNLSPGAAAQLHLHLGPPPAGLRVTGVGGEEQVRVAEVKVFTLAGVDVPNVEFLVGGSEVSATAIGLLGQNVLHVADVEYDLAKGSVMLLKPKGCGDANLAYWAKDLPVSVMELRRDINGRQLFALGTAKVNGTRIRVLFDTGAATSVLSVRAASRAGIATDGPGVTPAGYSRGIGRKAVRSWLAPVASFEIGGEEIKNTRLRIGDIGEGEEDMLLGADFFLSHHVYVANSQDKIYFTYSGGPVFNLTHTQDSPQALAAATAPQATPSNSAGEAKDASKDAPTDAEGYSRRGAALAARRDYVGALADFEKACALAPEEPRYFYQRAEIHLATRQPFLAMGDLDTVLKLKPDDQPARVARAQLRLTGRDLAGARADLDAAAATGAKEADLRLTIAELYLNADLFEPSIAQFDLWIVAHPDDSRRAIALTGRCRARALPGMDLTRALSDCNGAVSLSPRATGPLESRGLTRLRMGDYARAVADYDTVIAANPKYAWAFYGRGVAKAKMGQAAAGAADIAAADALAPGVSARAKRLGITP